MHFRFVKKMLLLCILSGGMFTFSGCATHNQFFAELPLFEAKSDRIPGLLTPEERKEMIREKVKRGSQESPQVQEMVARQLWQEYRTNPDPTIRRQIAESIPQLNAPSRQSLLKEAVEDPNVFVRISACRAWGKQQTPEASQALRHVLEEDEESDVRIAAARELGNFRGEEVTRALGKALESRQPAVRYQAMESLGKITGENFGKDVKRWKQYLQGIPPDPAGSRSFLEQIGLSHFPSFF
jgi:Glu-tRNA(Gln) amidotransferase subunit E-like FAD-binding protein